MNRRWQIQEAKNKLSQVIDEALTRGPQIITKHGVQTVVVLSYAEYRRLQCRQKKLSEFFRESPLADAELDLARDRSPVRESDVR